MKLSKKIINVLVLSLTSSLILTGCVGGIDKGEKEKGSAEFTFKLGHPADENNTWHKGVEKFAKEVKEKSKGRIEIKVYSNNQLGNEVENITSIQAGTADMVLSGETLQNWAEKVGIMSTPYLIRDSDHMKKVIEGEPGKILEKEISEKAGMHALTYFERGPRMLTSNKPVNKMEDLKDLKLRIPNVPLFVDIWDNWSAKPTPMAFSEVFTSLQQNTIEAQENPLALMNSGGFYEVQKYINNTQHVSGWIYILIGNEQWNSLPDDLKTVMEDAANVAQNYEHELFLKDEQSIKESLIKEKGMKWIDTDTTKMVEVAEKYYNKNFSPEILKLYNMIKNIK